MSDEGRREVARAAAVQADDFVAFIRHRAARRRVVGVDPIVDDLRRRAFRWMVRFIRFDRTAALARRLETPRAVEVNNRADIYSADAERAFRRALRRAAALGYDPQALGPRERSTRADVSGPSFFLDYQRPTFISAREHLRSCLKLGVSYGGTREGIALDWAIWALPNEAGTPLPSLDTTLPDPGEPFVSHRTRTITELPPIQLAGDIEYITVDVFVDGVHQVDAQDIGWSLREDLSVQIRFHHPVAAGSVVAVSIGVHYNPGDEYAREMVQWRGTAPDFADAIV